MVLAFGRSWRAILTTLTHLIILSVSYECEEVTALGYISQIH